MIDICVMIQSNTVEVTQYFNSLNYYFIYETGSVTNASTRFQVLFQITQKSVTLGLPAAGPSASLISAHFAPHQQNTRRQEEVVTFADSTEKSASFLKSDQRTEQICLAAAQSQGEAITSWGGGHGRKH